MSTPDPEGSQTGRRTGSKLRSFLKTFVLILLILNLGFTLLLLKKDFRKRVFSSDSPGAKTGRYRAARNPSNPDASQESKDEFAALSYVQGSQKAQQKENVTIYEKPLTFDGLNLVNSAHDYEASLMDMNGKVLHRWHYDTIKLWPEAADEEQALFWRRVRLLKGGELLAICEGIGLIKLNKDSQVIWSIHDGFHHAIAVTEDGTLYGLTRENKIIPDIHPQEEVLENYVTIVSRDGKVQKKVSVFRSFWDSPYQSLIRTMKKRKGDVFHTNSIQVFDGKLASKSPLFNKGNVLLTLPFMNTIAILDLGAQKVIWAMTGMFLFEHECKLLDNGNMLLFDNHGENGKSRVMEFDPLTQQVVWKYSGDPKNPLFSFTCGLSQRLPNGNTLITESDAGRALEVTADRKIVWEYVSPYRAGANKELVATLLQMERFAVDAPEVQWLHR